MTAQAELTKEYIIELQIAEIDKLRAEVQRLVDWIMGDADAHTTLQSIYLDPNASQGNRIKAASAALPVEKPKLGSILPPGQVNRRERWRIYELWSQRREIIIQTKSIPRPGWDAHLQPDTYKEPEGKELPPVHVELDPVSGFRTLTNLLPSPDRRNGNGD
jgi:hypothetical protein